MGNIVVITGSPRKEGNSFAMTEAFINAAKAQGHHVTRFDVANERMSGCHACKSCFKTDKACVYDDLFNQIAPAILNADGVVLTMPVYWYSFPMQIKGVIDKFYSFYIGGKDVSGKKCALIACCEEDNIAGFNGILMPYRRTAAFLKWKCVGEVLVQNVLKVGDIYMTNGCARAAQLAKEF